MDSQNVFKKVARALLLLGFGLTPVLAQAAVTSVSDTDGASDKVLEHAGFGTAVGITATAVISGFPLPPPTYSLDDDANGAFQINPATGVVTVLDPGKIDRESDASLDITVRAQQAASFQTFNATIVLTPVNEFTPTVTSVGTGNADENTGTGVVVYQITATDDDLPAETLSFTVMGPDAGDFNVDLNDGEIRFVSAPDFENPDDSNTDNQYAVTMRVSDGTNIGTKALLFDVNPVSDNDPVITSVSSVNNDENVGTGTIVYKITATDLDEPAEGITYSIFGPDAADFIVDSDDGEVRFASNPDFEAPADTGADNTYNITVRATDTGLNNGDQAVTITVDELNDNNPVLTSPASANVDENTGTGVVVYQITANDADLPAETLSFSISGTDAGDFTVDNDDGEIRFNVSPDFESPNDDDGDNVYELIIRVDDPDFNFDDQAITITVDELNDNTPALTSGLAVNVDENTGTGVVVYQITGTDGDLPAETLTFSISGTDAADFTVDSDDGEIRFNASPDFELPADGNTDNIYELTVRVDDPDFNFDDQAITITVDELNDNTPAITSAVSANADENTLITAVVYQVTATDADLPAETLTYSISGGADAADFNIDSNDGEIRFAVSPDFEAPADANTDNTYELTIRVDDPDLNFDDLSITIVVDEVNDNTPALTSGLAVNVDENTGTGVVVYQITADDDDLPPETLTYSISGTDAGDFIVDSNDGEIRFAVSPDFEAPADDNGDNVYELTVRVDDPDLNFDDQAITITVDELNDNTPVLTSGLAVNVDENTGTGVVVYQITGTDGDLPTETLTFSISGTDAADFTVDSDDGEIRFNVSPDFESPNDDNSDNVYELTVRVDDPDLNFDDQAITITVDELNDNTPAITSAVSANADENTLTTAVVYQVTATDADLPAETLTYSITGGADAADFNIDSDDGEIRFAVSPDFEAPADANTDATYELTVRVDDPDLNFDDLAITIVVDEVNDNTPALTSGLAVNADENTLTTVAVYQITATDADLPTETLTYSISGTDAADFTIDSDDGEIRFAVSPDFESPADDNGDNVYELTVRVDDPDLNFDDQAITITVDELNDNTPAITSAVSANADENTLTTVAVYQVTATDADLPAETLTYSITGGADAADFNIDSDDGEIRFAVSPDFEAPADADTDNTYELTVRVDDPDLNFDDLAITIVVDEVNDNTPALTSGLAVNADENTLTTVAVYQITATDADLPPETLTYSISGTDAADFTVDSDDGEIRFAVSPDFESPADDNGDNVYELTVRVDDPDLNFDDQAITITVDELNDNTPAITSAVSANTDENTLITAVVYQVTATDADLPAETLTYSISGGADAADFNIDSNDGEIRFAVSPDFEAPADANTDNTYELTVRVDDPDLNFDDLAITIVVDEVNDNTPALTSGLAVNADENTLTTVAVYQITATDADLPPETLTYSISGTDAADFTVDSDDGEIRFAVSPDFESPADDNGDNVYELTVRVDDPDLNFDDQAITITVDELNDNTPAITSAVSANTDENTLITAVVYQVTATDADLPAETLTYSISGGADAADFNIDSNDGEIRFAVSPDFEAPADANTDNTYELTVRVDDPDLNFDDLAITIVVDEVNDNTPALTSGLAVNADENTLTTVAVYQITATDADLPPETLTYSISGTDAADFTVDSDDGEIRFAVSPDFESPADDNGDNVYELTVRVDDPDLNFDDQAITITVDELNDNTPVLTSGLAVNVDENTGTGVVVYQITGTDADLPTETLTFSISGADAADFTVDSDDGEIRFNSSPDFELPADANTDNVYELTVRIDDPDLNFDDQAITITVDELNDNTPAITSAVSANTDENTLTTVVVYQVTATDADLPAETLTYSISGGADAADFNIDSDDGEIRFAVAPDFETPADADTDNTYELTVRVDDPDLNFDDLAITIVVDEVNDNTPVLTSGLAVNVDENTGTGVVVYQITGTDADLPTETLTFSISGADAADFTVDSDDGEIRFNSSPDFELPADANNDNVYELTVRIDDPGSNFDDQAITITVDELNDNTPAITSAVSANTDENTLTTVVVYQVSATDADLPAETLTYSISGGVDAADFNIDSDDGEIRFAVAPDFETPLDNNTDNTFELIVRVDDPDLNFDDQAITIVVDNVNENPTVATPIADQNVNEDALDVVIDLSSVFADVDLAHTDNLTLSISNNTNGSLFSSTNFSDVTADNIINDRLTLDFAANENGTADITVEATDDGGLTITDTFTVTVAAINDDPVISDIGNITINEDDNTGALAFTADEDDQGGLTNEDAQTLSLVSATSDDQSLIADANVVVVFNDNGTAGSGTVTVTPTANQNGAATITIVLTDGVGGTVQDQFVVTVTPVNDQPFVSAPFADVSASEDDPDDVTADMSSVFDDVDIVTNADSLTFTANSDNATLVTADIVGTQLTLDFQPNRSGTANVTLRATDTGTLFEEDTFTVTVAAVADVPTLTPVAAVSGDEDTSITLTLNGALTDVDGSETLMYTIDQVPATATLSAGTDNGSGNWTLTPAQASGVTISQNQHVATDFTLDVTATATETSNSDTATTAISNIAVTFNDVADMPTLTVNNAVSVDEDQAVGLGIASALVDQDGSETLMVTISNLPAGAEISDGTNSSSTSSTNVSSWTLGAITFIGPNHDDADVPNLTVTSRATETTGGDFAETVEVIAVTVTAVADAPNLSGNVSVAAVEDNASAALNLASSLVDTDLSETLSLSLSGVPNGSVVTDGTFTENATGAAIDITAWTIAAITITPPADSDAEFTVTTTATSTEVSNADTDSVSLDTDVVVTGVADTPGLTVGANTSGGEDLPIPLSVTGTLSDTDGSETLSYLISNVPTGATLNNGVDNLNNTWTLTAADATGLTITAPSNSDADFVIQARAIATDTDGAPAATGDQAIAVEVLAVPDMPTLTVSDVSGDEDTVIDLIISATLNDNDGSETLTFRAENVLAEATITPGTKVGIQDWEFTAAEVLGGLKISLPANNANDHTMVIRARATEANDPVGGSNFVETLVAPGVLQVTFNDIADTTNLTVTSPAIGTEDIPVSLSASATLTDLDGSEVLTIVFSNVPTGATLSAGTDQGSGVWSVTEGDLAGLTISAPEHNNDDFTLTVTATATEQATSDTQVDVDTIDVQISQVNDAPTVDDQDFDIDENVPNGTLVGVLIATDIEPVGSELAQDLNYSLSGTAFAIDSNGNITVADNTQVDYEINQQFVLTATVTDTGLPSQDDTATVTIDINPLNDNLPVVAQDDIAVDELDTAVFNVFDNDSDADEPIDVLVVTEVDGDPAKVGVAQNVEVSGVSIGTLTVNSDGSATFVTSSDPTVEVYSTSHTYSMTDGFNIVSDVPIEIEITPYNDNQPEVTAAGLAFEAAGINYDEDTFTVSNKEVIQLAPYFRDLDIDSDGIIDGSTSGDQDSLEIQVVSNSDATVVSTNIDPSNPTDLEIWSDANGHGTSDLVIRATDTADPSGNISSVDINVTVTVTSVNDAPLYVNSSYSDLVVDEDAAPLVIQTDSAFADNDIDADADPNDDTLTFTITIDDVPNDFVTTPVVDVSALNVVSETPNVPSLGARRVVVETQDPSITLPFQADAHGELTITVRATDLGRPPLAPTAAIPLFDEETFTVTVQAVGDDTPVANDDHHSSRPDLVMDEDGDAIIFEVTSNDYAGDAPIEVYHVGTEISDLFGAHRWRTTSRMADPDGTGDLVVVLNGEVSCSSDICQDDETPDTQVDGSGLATSQIIYRPEENFNGEDAFIYCIQDSAPADETPATLTIDLSDPRCAEVTILVNPVNDLPIPDDPVTFVMDQADDLIVAPEDGLRTKVRDIDNTHLDGIGCDPEDPGCNPGPGDPQPDTLYFFLTPDTQFGDLEPPYLTDGSFTYRPDATFFGEDSFHFDVCETPVPQADSCVFGVEAFIVVQPILGAPEGSSDDVVEFDFDLAETPLELPVGPEANVLIINDDSGSMDWDILTDENNGYYYFPGTSDYVRYALPQTAGGDSRVAPPEEDAPGVGLWRVRTSDYNTVYYNPAIRYDPWEGLTTSDEEFPDSSPTAAPNNPLTPSTTTSLLLPIDYTGRAVTTTPETCNDVCIFEWFGSCLIEIEVCTGGSNFQFVDVEDFYIPRYYTWTDLDGDTIIDATPSPANEPVICDTDRTVANGCSEGELVEITQFDDSSNPKLFAKSAGRTDCVDLPINCTYDEEIQNFANWFTYSRNREFTAKSALGKVVAAAENIRIGYAKLNSTSNTRAIEPMNTSERTGAKAALLDAIYQTGASGGTPLRQALRNAGRHYECAANDIFGSSGTSLPGDSDCPILPSPDGNCQQNYTLLISDGAWNGNSPSIGEADDDSSSNFDGGVYAGSTSNTLADVAMHYYERDLQSTLANEVPTSGRDTAGAADDAFEDSDNEFTFQHMKTFTVGFGVDGDVADGDVPTDFTQSFNWGNPTTTARKVDDMRHAAVNGRGEYLSAGDASQLSEALVSAFEEFSQGSGAASAVSFNSRELREDTLIFRSFYNTKNNTGDLIAQPLDEDGNIGDVVWSAADELDSKTFDTREIITYNPTDKVGSAFRPPSAAICGSNPCLDAEQRLNFVDDPMSSVAQQNVEITQRVNYLRGDDSFERPVGNFRERPVVAGRLGDIVHSAPAFVGPPRATGRDQLPYPQSKLYSDFRDENVDRRPMVYVSANDGMMHGFDAADGEEVIGYVPGHLMVNDYSRNIAELLNYEYVHKNFVDLSPQTQGAFTDVDGDDVFEWATVLLGGHGSGAKAYFALDITDPDLLDESTASSVVMWEFTDEDDAYPTIGGSYASPTKAPNTGGGLPLDRDSDGNPDEDQLSPAKPVKDLGYTFSEPTMVMTNVKIGGTGPDKDELRWMAFAGNGYNSTAGFAKLFALFLDGGVDGVWCHPDKIHNDGFGGGAPDGCSLTDQDFIKLDTGVDGENGFPNGLGEPRSIDLDGNGTSDYIYAGDFLGNFYRFDVTSSDINDWSVTRIFTAEYTDSGGSEIQQPITTQPIAVRHPTEDEGFIIIFATGSYIRTSDATDPSIQSIYGLWDRLAVGAAGEIDPTTLVEQRYTNVVDTFGRTRLLTANIVDYSIAGGRRGWRIDLDMPPAGSPDGASPEFPGEKAIRNIQLRGGLAFVNSVFPRPQNSCVGQAGGASLVFCPTTGGSNCLNGRTVFDLDGDGQFSSADDINTDGSADGDAASDNPEGGADTNSQLRTALGRIIENSAPPTDSAFIDNIRITQIGGETEKEITNTSFGKNTGRLSWRRLETVN